MWLCTETKRAIFMLGKQCYERCWSSLRFFSVCTGRRNCCSGFSCFHHGYGHHSTVVRIKGLATRREVGSEAGYFSTTCFTSLICQSHWQSSSHSMKWYFLINPSLPSAGGFLFEVPGHRHTGSRPGYKDGRWRDWHQHQPHWLGWWIHSTRRWAAPLSQHAPTNTAASKVTVPSDPLGLPVHPTHLQGMKLETQDVFIRAAHLGKFYQRVLNAPG